MHKTQKGVIALTRPTGADEIPVLVSSPHSGRDYASTFCERTHAALGQLRRSEDAFVDDLIEGAPAFGATTLCALFPRVFVDVNRRVDELDPKMFADRLPEGAFEETRRTASGLGVLPRVTADGAPLYRRKFRYAEAVDWLDTYYRPYHDAMAACLEDFRQRFGIAIVLDIHSMPKQSARGADIVLGDRYGQSCSPLLTEFAETVFREAGYVTVRNTPYAGGYTTEHYGRPEAGVHAIQVEINRSLYMDESRVATAPGFRAMREKMLSFVNAVANKDWSVALTS